MNNVMRPNAFSSPAALCGALPVGLQKAAILRKVPFQISRGDCYLDARLWQANLHGPLLDALHLIHCKPLCPHALGKEIYSLICFLQDKCIWK